MAEFIVKDGLLVSYTGDDVRVVVPDGVKIIEQYAFLRCEATEIVLPEGLENIRMNAFRECRNLLSITIPTTVKRIGAWAFCYCEKLKTVLIPKNVRALENYTFLDCKALDYVVLGSKEPYKIGTEVITGRSPWIIAWPQAFDSLDKLGLKDNCGSIVYNKRWLMQYLFNEYGDGAYYKVYNYLLNLGFTPKIMLLYMGNETLEGTLDGLENNALAVHWVLSGNTLEATWNMMFNKGYDENQLIVWFEEILKHL